MRKFLSPGASPSHRPHKQEDSSPFQVFPPLSISPVEAAFGLMMIIIEKIRRAQNRPLLLLPPIRGSTLNYYLYAHTVWVRSESLNCESDGLNHPAELAGFILGLC